MKKINETQKLIIYEEVLEDKTIFYREHKEDENHEKIKIHEEFDGKFLFPFEGESIKEIIIEGFKELPDAINRFGFGLRNRHVSNFFQYKFKDDKVKKLIISKEAESKKIKDALRLNVSDLESLEKEINQEQYACTVTKNTLIKNLLSDKFPELPFDFAETNSNKSLVLRNLNSKLIDKLNAEEVEEIGKFYVRAVSKFKRADIVKRATLGIQKKSQFLALKEVVYKYEALLKENPAEKVWQKFFEEYITLFDSRYLQQLNYKNIATAITKYPDLVLIDIYGYIDFYELKKSETKILQYDSSHKTFYWSKDFSMVIAQVSDYIQKAKENSLAYANTIKTETDGLDVNIISPRAIVVAGHSKELDTVKKRNHFKTLRESLKDIEFVLYDELLERLKNLMNSIEPEITD